MGVQREISAASDLEQGKESVGPPVVTAESKSRSSGPPRISLTLFFSSTNQSLYQNLMTYGRPHQSRWAVSMAAADDFSYAER